MPKANHTLSLLQSRLSISHGSCDNLRAGLSAMNQPLRLPDELHALGQIALISRRLLAQGCGSNVSEQLHFARHNKETRLYL